MAPELMMMLRLLNVTPLILALALKVKEAPLPFPITCNPDIPLKPGSVANTYDPLICSCCWNCWLAFSQTNAADSDWKFPCELSVVTTAGERESESLMNLLTSR